MKSVAHTKFAMQDALEKGSKSKCKKWLKVTWFAVVSRARISCSLNTIHHARVS